MDHGGGLADGAVLGGWATKGAGGSEELGMGIANVELRQPSAPELAEEGVAGQAVVDLAGEAVRGRGAGHGLRPGIHGRPG